MSNRLARLWELLRREKWLLLLCFVLSFFAWQAIQRNIGFELPVSNVAVEIEVPEGWAVLDRSVDSVDLRILGSWEDIRDINREQLRVVIPIDDPKSGTTMAIQLDSKYLRNKPVGTRILPMNPSEIEIRLDKEKEKPLPVKAAYEGSLPDGIEIESIICKPATVLVKGAQQQVDQMENIHTESVDLKNRQSSFKENVRVALPHGGRIQTEPDRVSVEFVLVTRSSTAVFEKVPVHVLCSSGERRRIDIQPLAINVTVKGQQQRIDQLRSTGLIAYVSCTDLSENTGYDLPPIIQLPASLQLIKTEPAAVHVEIGNVN